MVLLAAATVLGVEAYHYTDAYQDRQWGHLTLEQYRHQLDKNRDQPNFLYHFATLLNQKELFKDAQTLTERASERLPDSARIRNEWGSMAASFARSTFPLIS